jgi:hypothetical protein
MVERQSIEFMASPLQYVGRCGGSCCGRALRNPSKSNAVAVLRFHRGERVRRLTRCLDARLTTSAAVLSLYTRGTLARSELTPLEGTVCRRGPHSLR